MLAVMSHVIEHGTRPPGHGGEVVDSLRHPLARRVADVLRTRSAKPRTVLVDDPVNIAQARRHGLRLDGVYVTDGTDPAVVAEAAAGATVHVLSEEVAARLFSGEKRSRVFALARLPRPARLGDLTTSQSDLVVLDGVRLTGNIGAVVRSARAMGAAGVVLLDSGLRTVADRRLVRASRGLVFALPVVLATHRELLDFVGCEGMPLAVLGAEATEELGEVHDVPERLALVVGGERDGVSPELGRRAAHRYAIPTADDVESLNVSVAAAIALYERRARNDAGGSASREVHR